MSPRGISFFDRHLSVWVILCVGVGVALGRFFPNAAGWLAGVSIAGISLPLCRLKK